MFGSFVLKWRQGHGEEMTRIIQRQKTWNDQPTGGSDDTLFEKYTLREVCLYMLFLFQRMEIHASQKNRIVNCKLPLIVVSFKPGNASLQPPLRPRTICIL